MDRERHQAFVKEQESSEVAEFDKSQVIYSQESKEDGNAECDREVSR
jgi:hypothetical protein